jgi:hypothetical protein
MPVEQFVTYMLYSVQLVPDYGPVETFVHCRLYSVKLVPDYAPVERSVHYSMCCTLYSWYLIMPR